MSIFKFGRKNQQQQAEPAVEQPADPTPHEVGHRGKERSVAELIADNPSPHHNAVDTEIGPFDGDSVNFDEFDFTDFAEGHLDLGSVKVAIPQGGQLQVEMGEAGPKALHIVTAVGRVTPVAFAAPRSSGYWDNHALEVAESMARDGLEVVVERGTWGNEIVGTAPQAVVRVIGVDGPRWMLRTTVAAPTESARDAADIARKMVARSFVYRGSQPRIAGEVLPIELPEALAAQISQAAAEHAATRNNRSAFAQKVQEQRLQHYAAAQQQPRQDTSAEQRIAADNEADEQ